MNQEEATLGEALPRAMTRVRDHVMPTYVAIGPSGAFGLMFMRQALDRAAKAMAEGDVVAMIAAIQELREFKT